MKMFLFFVTGAVKLSCWHPNTSGCKRRSFSSFNLEENIVLLCKLPPYVQSNRHQCTGQMFFDHPSFVTSTCVCHSRLSHLWHCLAFPSLLFGDSYLLGLLQLQVRTQRQHFTCLPFYMFLSVHFAPFLSQIQHLPSTSCLPGSLPTLPLSDYSPLSLLFIQVNDFIQLSDFVRTDAGKGFKAEPGKKKGRKKRKDKEKGWWWW